MKQQEHGRIRMRTDRERSEIRAKINRNLRLAERLEVEIDERRDCWQKMFGTNVEECR